MSDGIIGRQPDIDSPLADLRWKLARALEDSNWPVHASVVDAVAGPCYVLLSGNIDPLPTYGCNYMTHPAILCVAGRIEPGAGSDVLDAQVCEALALMPFDLDRVDDETLTTFGGVPYLTRRVVMHTTVTIDNKNLMTTKARTFR